MLTHAMLLLALVSPGDRLVEAVSGDNVFGHLQAFQAIADAHGGNRAAGLPGYDASADYVAGRLREAGYTVELQPFDFDFYRELAPALVESQGRTYGEASTLVHSGSGDVTARPQRAGDGCERADFDGFARGRVALVKRGACAFGVKARNAAEAGAGAVVVVNDGDAFAGSVGKPLGIPVVGVGAKAGAELGRAEEVRVRARTESETRRTHNVIAQLGTGEVVMTGAHLDSRLEGPGINDNGTGSAAILEVALQAARLGPDRALRFAWWGAEEEGLLGSQHYVDSLSAAERAKIRLYLNLDMIGSPNATFGIYDGDDSDEIGAGPGPKGSAEIEKAFERYFTGRGLPYQGTDFSGRSDYGPFIMVGIPSGGLFTGAEVDKSEEEARIFGGTAGQPLDPCYHRTCDDLRNVDPETLDIATDAVAAVVGGYVWAP